MLINMYVAYATVAAANCGILYVAEKMTQPAAATQRTAPHMERINEP